MNCLPSECLGIVGHAAGTANSTPLVTAYHKMDNARKLAVLVALGNMASEVITVTLYKASDSAGTGAAAIAAKTVSLTANATANDNTAYLINFDSHETDETKPYLAGAVLTDNVTGGPVGIILLAMDARFGSIKDLNLTTVTIKT